MLVLSILAAALPTLVYSSPFNILLYLSVVYHVLVVPKNVMFCEFFLFFPIFVRYGNVQNLTFTYIILHKFLLNLITV